MADFQKRTKRAVIEPAYLLKQTFGRIENSTMEVL